MKLARIGYEPEKVRQEMVALGGLNWSDRLRDGELRDSLNVSGRRWPYLTTRKARTEQAGYSGVTALTAHGKLVAVRGTELLLDGKKVGTVKAGAKRFATVNTKLVIWPDMVYLDLEDNRVKPMGAKVTLPVRTATFTGDTIDTDSRPIIPPEKPNDKREDSVTTDKLNHFPKVKRCKAISRTAAGWVMEQQSEIKFSQVNVGDIVLLTDYGGIVEICHDFWGEGYPRIHQTYYGVVTGINERYGGWVDGYHASLTYDVYYCPLRVAGLMDQFKAGDAVVISGAGENDKESAVIKEVTATTLTFSDHLFEKEGMVDTAVTIERKVPPLEFICESQNRLWGCEGHTIWASALGDPTNFYTYEGLSTDSYAVAVGSDGAFTGCAGYSEGVLFWKEDCLHKILGTYPANYELHTYSVQGVKAGCDRSQVIVSDVLYYLGERGVYAYTGGTPQLLSDCFGEKRFTEGAGGSDGERYFLSVKEGNASHLLVYDPGKGMWLREDGTAVRDFARLGNRLYFADGAGKVWLEDGGGEDPGQEWMAQFTPFYETIQGRKRYSRLLLRLELPLGSWVMVETRCDDGPWQECGTVAGRKQDVVPLRVPFNRCDKFELRLRGKGSCTVLSVMREFMVGSER